MSTPTPDERAEAVFDAWELHWRCIDHHVYEVTDPASEDLRKRIAAALRDAERRGAEAEREAILRLGKTLHNEHSATHEEANAIAMYMGCIRARGNSLPGDPPAP